jgi:putative ABC transport system permease protein
MFTNNFKIAFRSLVGNKVYSIINITGLATALCVVLLISLYIKDDLTFDRFHIQGEQLFRIVSDVDGFFEEGTFKNGNTGHIQGPIFKDEIPEIENFCRIKNGWNTLVKKGDEAFKEDMIYADSTIFSMFTFDYISGSAISALDKTNNIVITEPIAQKYFGTNDAIGKILYVGDEGGEMKPFEVSAVVKKMPSNSSIQFDLLCSFTVMLNADPHFAHNQSWFSSNLNTFVLLRKDANKALIQDKIDKVANIHIGKESEERAKEDPIGTQYKITYKLQSFFDMHLDPEYFADNGVKNWSNIKYPKILSGIAMLLILIAAINFINLSLARSMQRSKEIGIRKTTGSTRSQLFAQFMIESVLTTAIAAIPAFIIAYSLIPEFSELTGKYLSTEILFKPASIIMYAGLVLMISFAAGAYPSFVMSGFQPIKSLKGRTLVGTKNGLRQSLVVLQFTLASVLMVCTAFITQQFRYIQNKPLGYDISDRYRFWLPWDQIEKLGQNVKAELGKLNDVLLVSSKSGDGNKTKYNVDGKETGWIYYEHVDINHLQLMNIPLVSGRYFSTDFALDSVSNIIVNETFVKNCFPKGADPYQFPVKRNDIMLNIVGVVKDFHYRDFKEKIEPMVFILDRGTQAGMIHVQTKPGRSKEALAAIQTVYKKFVPYLPMEVESLEEYNLSSYAEEIREKKIVTYTALLAIIIACLGLFGLATFMTGQRTKEIGIRKVFGANISVIAFLVSKDFVRLVLLSSILATPIGYYLTRHWLDNFTYRIDISWWIFVGVAILSVMIAFVTVFYQTLKAAMADPVKSLRVE